MDAIILGIGSELTIGNTVNTNAAWLSQQLIDLGIPTVMHVTVPDDMPAMCREIARCAEMADVVIITGGLGPTEDDLTRDAVQQVFGFDYERHAEGFATYERRCRDFNYTIPVRGPQQFDIPKGGVPLPNSVGVAWGYAYRHARRKPDGKPLANDAPLTAGEGIIAILPGVPVEMQAICREHLWPYLERVRPVGKRLFADEVRVAGLAEAEVNERAKDLLDPAGDPSGSITIYEEAGGIVLRFTTADADESAARARLATVVTDARQRLGANVYGGKDETVAGALAKLLAAHDLTIGLAESCTGGLATHFLSRVPGISAHLMQSVVAYSNAAKIERVGVPKTLIDTHGAVSEEVAAALAEGICKTGGVAVGIGITGIAGPGGGTKEKPVGLVCIGAHVAGHTATIAKRFPGDRFHIQRRSAQFALNFARMHLLNFLPSKD